MNPKSLLCVCALGLLSSVASAALQSLSVDYIQATFGSEHLYALKLFARFSDPADQVVGVSASEFIANFPIYQHPFGTDTEPLTPLIFLSPALAYDSFVTVGHASISDGPPTALMPGTGFQENSFTGGWTATSEGSALAGIEGTVLLAQITASIPAPVGAPKVSVSLILDWKAADGTTHSTYLQFKCMGVLTPIFCPTLTTEIDSNHDCVVNGFDLAAFLARWGVPCPAPFVAECVGDFNDAVVDGLDLVVLLARWGPTPVCPPK